MNSIQEHLLRLVLEIDVICEEHGLKYYMGGGCLIGAMRNKGFLPWDDDADIHMTRKDAYKLLELFHENKLPANRAVVSYEDYSPCAELHWRYEDISCSAVLRSTIISNAPQGQFVDIFILNPAPDSERERRHFSDDLDLAWDLYVPFVINSRRNSRVVKRYRRWRRIAKIIGEDFVNRHFRKKCLMVPDDDSKDVTLQAVRPPQVFWPRRFFGEGRRVPFENTTVCVPEYAEEILTYAYGEDWVNVPLFTERESHAMIVDTDFPYDYYRRDFQYLSGSAESRRVTQEYKDIWFGQLYNRNYSNPRISKMRLMLKAQELECAFQERKEAIEELSMQGDYEDVREAFVDFFSLQSSENVSYWKLFVPVSDEYLSFALLPDVMLGSYSSALKTIEQRQSVRDENLNHRLSILKDICLDAKSVMTSLWTFKDYDSARTIVEKRTQETNVSVVFYRAKLMLDLMEEDMPTERLEDVRLEALEYLRRYPKDGELMYWLACVDRRLGRFDEAERYFKQSSEKLMNGILRTRALEMLRQNAS